MSLTTAEKYPNNYASTYSNIFTNPTNAYSLDGVFATAVGTLSGTNPGSLFLTESGGGGGTGFTPTSTLDTTVYNNINNNTFSLDDLYNGLVEVLVSIRLTTGSFNMPLRDYNFSTSDIPIGSTLISVVATMTKQYVDTTFYVDTVSVHAVYNPPAPVALFSNNQTNVAIGESISFTDTSVGVPTSWSWTFGDGSTSTSQNPTHSYSSAGTYTVALTATNDGGSETVTKTNLVTVTDNPKLSGISTIQGITSITL